LAITDTQLQAAFLAARGRGKILDDEVLRAVITAAADAPQSTEGRGRSTTTDDLFARIKQVEQPDGGWPGADVVDVLCEWFTSLGYDINAPTEDGEEGEDDG